MAKIIGVRFRSAGRIYYFDPESLDIRLGSHVIVETARGVECGRVVLAPTEMSDEKIVQPLKKVIRIASEADEKRIRENKEKAREAFSICKKKIREHKLEMKLIDSEYTFDRKKILFYFTADGRVDFRNLIKDLASVFRTRIELRQIGVRDETKLLGGIGVCGRPLCCSTYLSDFAPVSIKMAKEQNLSLNPAKISGACGRLMCCLKNEADTYEYLNRQLPGVGDTVQTADGVTGEVQTVNILRQRVRVLIESDDETTVEDIPAEELTIIEKHKKGARRRKEKDVLAEKAAERANERRERQAERKRRTAGDSGSGKADNPGKTDSSGKRGERGARPEGSGRGNGGRPEGSGRRSSGRSEGGLRSETEPLASAAESSGAVPESGGADSAPAEKKRHRRRHRSKKNGTRPDSPSLAESGTPQGASRTDGAE
ncbi:MAG: regulatory iron-sulfur-containing complex subunit RicT [Bilifractor sp.]|jgi:cell fate regulator YaaT (PSP1 superfamily)